MEAFFINPYKEMTTKAYRGYVGEYRYSWGDKVYHGRLVVANDLISFESDTEEGVQEAFEEAVDDYLEICETVAKKPEQ